MKRLKINNSIKSVLAVVIIAAGVSLSPLPASADGDDLNLNTSGTHSSTVKNIIVGQNEKSKIEEIGSVSKKGEHIRFSIANLFALEDFSAQLAVNMANTSTSVKVEARKDEKLGGEVLLPASIGTYDATLSDSLTGEVIFNISGELSLEDGTYVHQVKNINSEKKALSILEGEEGFNILIGYVEGGIMAEVELLDNKFDQCLVNMSLDTNADGIFGDGEITQKVVNSSYSKIEGPQVPRLPLTSKYDVNIECDGFKVASNTGSYDLVNGEAIDSKKSRTASVIGTFGVGFKRNLYVSSDSVMGEDIYPPKQNLALTEKDGSDSWDTLSPRSSRDYQLQEEEAIDNSSNNVVVESNYSLSFILEWFIDNPWTYLPASLVLAIVVIACFSTVAFVAQRKNHI